MRKARAVEMVYSERLGVYERVPMSHQIATGGKTIGIRWVDINKGDTAEPDYRSRLDRREFAVGRDDALYAATAPLKALGLIISHAATIPERGPKRTLPRCCDWLAGDPERTSRRHCFRLRATSSVRLLLSW